MPPSASGSTIGRATTCSMTSTRAVERLAWTRGTAMPASCGAVLAQPRADRALVQVVELLLEPCDQLLAEVAQPDRARGLDAALELGGGEPQHGGVARDDLVDPGPLDLHHDRRAVGEHGAVGLSDRRGGERLELERAEGPLDRLAELGLEHLPDLGLRDLADVGAQLRELVGGRRGQHVGPRRGDLAELDQHPAGVLEHRAQAARQVGRLERRPRRVAEVQQVLLARVGDQLAQPPVRCERRAGGADRVQQPPPAPARPARCTRPGDQVDHDRDRHRREHAEHEHDRDHRDPVAGGLDVDPAPAPLASPTM